jgi:hypothetical protein
MPKEEKPKRERKKRPSDGSNVCAMRPTVQVVGGELPRIIDQLLEVMRSDGAVYDRAGELIRIAEGRIYHVKAEWLVNYLSALVDFVKWDGRSEDWRSINCPPDIAKTVMAMDGLWRFPLLDGVVMTPTVTPGGRVIDSAGYDRDSRLFLHMDNGFRMDDIPEPPTIEDAAQAVEDLWYPFKEFPFGGATDRGGYLAALLTVITRPLLPSAPGFLISSPTAGSGKTLLAKCLSALANQPIEVLPKVDDDEEMRKRLVSLSRICAAIICLDNISGLFKSDSLCAFLTSERLTDRVLGASEMISTRTSSTIIATGNNPIVEGDLNRRLIRIKIDPGIEKPFNRQFEINPLTHVTSNLMPLVRSAIIILKASIASGFTHQAGGFASFESWEFIRNAVIWVGENGWLDVQDPVGSIDAGYERDPETNRLGTLLSVWAEYYGPSGAPVSKAIREATSDKNGDLYAILDEVAGERGVINPRRLSRWIDRHEGRIIDNLRFSCVDSTGRAKTWAADLNVQKAQKVQMPPRPYGNCQNDTLHIRGNGTLLSAVSAHCSSCIWFNESTINPRGTGVCKGRPFDGRFSKLPTDGKDCPHFERERAN